MSTRVFQTHLINSLGLDLGQFSQNCQVHLRLQDGIVEQRVKGCLVHRLASLDDLRSAAMRLDRDQLRILEHLMLAKSILKKQEW